MESHGERNASRLRALVEHYAKTYGYGAEQITALQDEACAHAKRVMFEFNPEG